MNTTIVRSLSLAMLLPSLCGVLSSCQQIDMGSYSDSQNITNDDKNRVKITSRSGVGEEIPSPLKIYAVNEDGLVEDKASVAQGATSATLSLLSGSFTFYALAGADAGDSDVPANNVVSADEGYFTTPIMRGEKASAVDDDMELSMSLSPAVASVDVTLSNIPVGAKAVSVKIASLRESMSIEGEYAGTTTATLDLEKQADGTTWKSATAYVFPSVSAPTTLTITQTMADDSKQSYSATYNAKLLAGTPYHFKGTGNSISNHNLTISITTEGWDNAIEEELALTPIGAGDGAGTIDSDGETYLVSAMPTESGILLDGKYVLAYVDGDKGLLYAKQDCDMDKVSEYKEGDITGWSVPTLEQYNNIKVQAGLSKIYEAVNTVNNATKASNRYPNNDFFYCDNLTNAFSWNSGKVAVGTSGKVYHLRLVKPVTFKLK